MRSAGSIARGQRVAARRLARRSSRPTTTMFHPARTIASRNAARRARARTSASGTARPREPPDRDARPVGRERRQHRVQSRAVGQAGVDHRRRAVEPQPERRDRRARRPARSSARRSCTAPRSSRPVALDEDAIGTVHHDLGDRRVGEQRLERAEPADVVDAARRARRRPVAARERRLVAQHVARAGAQLGGVDGARDRTARRAAGGAASRAAPRAFMPLARRRRRADPRRPSACCSGPAELSGRRVASTPASTARAVDVRASIVASTGSPSTSSTSRAPSDRPCSSIEHHADASLERGVVHGLAQREIAAPHDDDVRVGDLGEARASAGVSSRPASHTVGAASAVERDRERGAGFGRDAVAATRRRPGSSDSSRRDVDGEIVRARRWAPADPRAANRARPGRDRRRGRAPRAGRRSRSTSTRRRRRRASTERPRRATTDVPEPPLGDQKQTSTMPPPASTRAPRARDVKARQGRQGEAAAHDVMTAAAEHVKSRGARGSSYAARVEAAFFDLDKTVIATSSVMALGGTLLSRRPDLQAHDRARHLRAGRLSARRRRREQDGTHARSDARAHARAGTSSTSRSSCARRSTTCSRRSSTPKRSS